MDSCSPCNCSGKTRCPLNGSCQHKNLVYSCKVQPEIQSKTICITLAIQNIHLKEINTTNIIILSITGQEETH